MKEKNIFFLTFMASPSTYTRISRITATRYSSWRKKKLVKKKKNLSRCGQNKLKIFKKVHFCTRGRQMLFVLSKPCRRHVAKSSVAASTRCLILLVWAQERCADVEHRCQKERERERDWLRETPTACKWVVMG